MYDFIKRIETATNISVFVNKNSKEILVLKGQVMEVKEEDEVINIDMDSAEITIDKSWGVIIEGNDYIFNGDDDLNLYITILD